MMGQVYKLIQANQDEVLADTDIAWAAGFLEGEGHFSGDGRSPQVEATQNNSSPLLKLRELFGGSVRPDYWLQRRDKETYIWRACGSNARRCIDLIYPYLSDRRQVQADRAYTRKVS